MRDRRGSVSLIWGKRSEDVIPVKTARMSPSMGSRTSVISSEPTEDRQYGSQQVTEDKAFAC